MNCEAKIIYTFTVLHESWECDSQAWVMQNNNGERWIETTSHGGRYDAKVDEFEDKIKEYQSVIDQTKRALELVAGNDD